MEQNRAVVIGAGVGGLAASIRLAVAGYETTVYEANPFVGGKIHSETLEGYRFDKGPSVFTGPQYLQELYELCGEEFSAFAYDSPDPLFTYTWPDGARLVLPRHSVVPALADFFGEDPQVLRRYLDKARRNYEAIVPVFIEGSLHRLSQLKPGRLLRALARLGAYRLGQTMHQENARTFRHPRTVQFFDRYATYNGSHPYRAPAMLNMICHLELNVGPYMPREGMVQISERLRGLAERQGVRFVLGTPVDRILVTGGRVQGVQVGGREVPAEVVMSNMDVVRTWKDLLPGQKAPGRVLDQEPSSSAVVFYWGVRKSFPSLHLHNLFFGSDYRAEFDALFTEGTLVSDPSIYINITSKSVPTDAPPGCENWFVMVNAPTNRGQDWPTLVSDLRRNVLAKLSRLLGEDLEALIEVEGVMDPPWIEKTFRGIHGSIYGIASNSPSAAFARHPNFSRTLPGLYFVGVTVHPGGGIPLAINSARIAMDCLEQDRRRVRR